MVLHCSCISLSISLSLLTICRHKWITHVYTPNISYQEQRTFFVAESNRLQRMGRLRRPTNWVENGGGEIILALGPHGHNPASNLTVSPLFSLYIYICVCVSEENGWRRIANIPLRRSRDQSRIARRPHVTKQETGLTPVT